MSKTLAFCGDNVFEEIHKRCGSKISSSKTIPCEIREERTKIVPFSESSSIAFNHAWL